MKSSTSVVELVMLLCSQVGNLSVCLHFSVSSCSCESRPQSHTKQIAFAVTVKTLICIRPLPEIQSALYRCNTICTVSFITPKSIFSNTKQQKYLTNMNQLQKSGLVLRESHLLTLTCSNILLFSSIMPQRQCRRVKLTSMKFFI